MKHPCSFGWLEIEKVSESIGHDSIDTTASAMGGLVSKLKFTRDVAFIGIDAGYRKKCEACPFSNSDELAETVAVYAELMPYVEEYTKAVASFYQVDQTGLEDLAGKKKVTP